MAKTNTNGNSKAGRRAKNLARSKLGIKVNKNPDGDLAYMVTQPKNRAERRALAAAERKEK